MKKLDGLLVQLEPPAYRGIIEVKKVKVKDSLEGIYEAMNVLHIEVPVIGNGWQMIVDEEGKINGRWGPTMSGEKFGLHNDVIFGPMLFLGLTDDGGNASLTKKQEEEIKKLLGVPEQKTWIFSVKK